MTELRLPIRLIGKRPGEMSNDELNDFIQAEYSRVAAQALAFKEKNKAPGKSRKAKGKGKAAINKEARLIKALLDMANMTVSDYKKMVKRS